LVVSALDNCADWRNGDRWKLVVISYPLVDFTPIRFNWYLVDGFSDFSAERIREKQFGDLAKSANDKTAEVMTAESDREANGQSTEIDHSAELPK
jgi:1,2-phenylacetyl-CoA epoxidase catalytic subunit